MFASLLVAVVHYIYFQFIDHGFIVNSYIQLWDELMTNTPALAENKDIIKETIDTARSLTSINITVMGCILGKYPGHSHRIDGNEKGQTGK